jgi:hypothetical protein
MFRPTAEKNVHPERLDRIKKQVQRLKTELKPLETDIRCFEQRGDGPLSDVTENHIASLRQAIAAWDAVLRGPVGRSSGKDCVQAAPRWRTD